MKKILVSIFLIFCHIIVLAQIDIEPDNTFSVCPNETLVYTAYPENSNSCVFYWKISGGTFVGGGTTATGNPVSVIWSSSATTGTLTVSASSCSPANDNGESDIKKYAIRSISGVTPGSITGDFSVTANVTTNQTYTVPQINYPKVGTGDPTPFPISSYEWEIPLNWTVVSGGSSRSIKLKPDNCSGGSIRVRGKHSCGGSTHYSKWSPIGTIKRTLANPGLISGDDYVVCSSTDPVQYSVTSVTGATSYAWMYPPNWIVQGSATGRTITFIPDGQNGGAITVKAVGCAVQSSASSKTVSISLTDINNPPSISSPDVVCFVPKPTFASSFTLENLPQNSSVSWTVSSNLTIISGQGTTTLKASASSSSTSGVGWCEALITTPCGSPPPIRKIIWVGKPYDFLVQGPTMVPPGSINNYEIKKWNVSSIPSFAEQGVGSNGFTWSFGWPATSAGWSCYNCTGQTNIILSGSQSTYVTGEVKNTCGTTKRNYEVFVECPTGDCVEPFIVISPNPSTGETTLSIESRAEEVSQKSSSAPEESESWTLEVYDYQKNLILKRVNLKNPSLTLNTSNWQTGIYAVRALYKDQVISSKLVVE